MNITKEKQPIWKGYILYRSNYMIFWKGQKYGESKKNQCLPGSEEPGMNRQGTEKFQGCRNTLCDTVMAETSHYTYVQSHRMYNTNSEL